MSTKSNEPNPLDEKFIEWFSGCYIKTAATMPAEQRAQIEAAFYAGAMSAKTVERVYGGGIVVDAVLNHIERVRKSRG